MHQNQFVATGTLLESLATLRRHSRLRLCGTKDLVGTNLAALQFLAKDIAETETQHLFGEKPADKKASRKRGREFNTVTGRKKPAQKRMRPRG